MTRSLILVGFYLSVSCALAQIPPLFQAFDSLPDATPWTDLDFDQDGDAD